MKKIFTFILLTVLSTLVLAQVNENFDNWSDGSYGTVSTYTDANGGQWETYNSMSHSQNACAGNSIRFNDDSGENEYLLYKGTDGNGKDGGIGTISFDYRHWDGDASNVEFQVQYNQNGAGWVNVGAVVNVSSTTCTQFSNDVNQPGDNFLVRVISIDDAERLLIDDFSISNFDGPLSVSFSSFTAKPMDAQTVELNWNTASEENNDYFSIQHSTDGRNFTEIGLVEGAGTTFATQEYHFVHKEAAKGMNYYRLQQVDFDGRYAFSPVEVVELAATAEIIVRPTLAENTVDVIFSTAPDQRARLEVINIMGKTVIQQAIGVNTDKLQLDVSTLHQGHYFVRIQIGNEISTTRFIKI